MAFKKIKFVTDSAGDLPPDLIQKWGITVVPCYVNYDGQSFADDGVELNREKYYDMLPGMRTFPTTAAPAPGLAEEFITKAFEDADHLIIVSVAATLSGVFNSMRLGASKLPQDRISLVDSGTLTMSQGWQVICGAEVAAETGDVEQTLAAIKRARGNQRLYAALATMEFLRRSGRVSWAAASIGALLQIKPLLDVREGEVHAAGRIRTFGKATEKLIEMTREQAPLDKISIMHTNNYQGALDVKNELSDILPEATIITYVGPTVGTHIGPGGLAVATVSKSWRQT
jgi:DegV family protein with EDD domain